MKLRRLLALCGLLLATACSSIIPRDLPEESPPLIDLEEPLTLQTEPDDEDARNALPLGGFSGLEVKDAQRSLDDDFDDAPDGVLVRRVIENSPADAAGLEEGDLLNEAVDADGKRHTLDWPSAWNQLERNAQAGDRLALRYDRAGVLRSTELTFARRVRSVDRVPVERFREQARMGVVVRTATEVEARAAGLGPGAGAVVVGLSRRSPLRAAGLQFEDLITHVNDAPVEHPQVLLDAIRNATDDDTLRLAFVRSGTIYDAAVPASRRASTLTEFNVPFLVSHEADRGTSETSVLLGLIRHRTTAAAWEWRLFWLIRISGGDADVLEETP